MVPSGLMSFHAHYGATRHLQVRPQGRHLSSWCMGLRLLSLRRSPWSPSMSRHTTEPHRTSSDVMISTSSMSEDGKQLPKMHGTVRRSDAITNGSCIVGNSMWTIWCFGAYSLVKAQICSPPTGRALFG
jgi:hypothetical protein